MHLRSLPVRESPLPGESLTSFVRRHVVGMGYESMVRLLSLVDEVELPSHLDHLGRGPPLGALSGLLGRPSSLLADLTVHRFAESLVLQPQGAPPATLCDSKTLLRFFDPAHPRVCPECLREGTTYERLLWSFRPLPICLEHGVTLLDRCPACGRHARPARLDLEICRCGFRLTETAAIMIGSGAFSSAALIQTCLRGEPFAALDLSPAAALAWLDRLRSAVARTPSWIERTRETFQLPGSLSAESVAWLGAAEFLEVGPARLAEFLDVYQGIAKHRSTSTGVNRAFGHLLRDAERLESLGYSGPADALRQYLLGRYTHGHLSGKTTLFREASRRRQLRAREWIPQTAAARQLGICVPTLARLVRQQVLAGRVHPAGKQGRTVGLVSRAAVVDLQRRLSTGFTVTQAAQRLGVDRHRVLELIQEEVLAGVVRIARRWRIPAAAVEHLSATVAQLPPLLDRTSEWLSLREATRRFGAGHLNLARIVRLLCAGRLSARREPNETSLRGVYLQLSDLRSCTEEATAQHSVTAGWTLNRLAKLLFPEQPLKDVVLRKWMGAGLLRGKRQAKQWCIVDEEVARFRTTYCLAQEACRILGISRSTLARWERDGRIAPVYGKRTHRAAGASLFRRADLSRLLDRTAA
ncbi:Helix-turn-helix domain protein [Anatilimnocola aggregata]|uniref:Helix-turn-helix domain protein n=1 Tax=Anatilimnocola aggregata TaxID=2528021 RepID=A0A517Y431_9BACT|nr:helix-turn-helix domain-containing protein [Anatilimnocola aggregata]QDU24956.1 Helix-turn-helix domain protein [Anatilimnocola aggregata]